MCIIAKVEKFNISVVLLSAYLKVVFLLAST